MLADYPFVHKNPNRHGKPRYYFRRKGYHRTRLPGEPGSPEFIAAYHEAMTGTSKPVEPLTRHLKAGSIAALVAEYERSTEYNDLAELTKREMGYVLAKLVKGHGERQVKAIERAHISRWRDAMKSTPGAANKMLRTVKVLLGFAVERAYRTDNPCSRIRMMKLGEHRDWTAEELQQFEQRWPLGTMERTGYALALYTGQRRADVAALTFKSIAGNKLILTQKKTDEYVQIPLHPSLREALAAVHPRCEGAILTTKQGKPMNPIYFGHMMAEAIDAAGLPNACVLHGLRKTAATVLIDIGCSPHQAAAVTGHQTIRMMEHYAKRRDRTKLGKAAILKWGRKKAG